MEIKKVFEETEKINNEISKGHERLINLNRLKLEMINICTHDIVFKYSDNKPRKKQIDGSYYCPACGENIVFISEKQFKESQFKDSKVISLTNLSLFGTNDVLNTIREEVQNNIDLYYNNNTSIEELTNKMESILESKQIKYETPKLILKRNNSYN